MPHCCSSAQQRRHVRRLLGSKVHTRHEPQSKLFCLLHGTFHVQRGTVAVDPATGKASGEIVVDAASGESGNNRRDRKMHNEILESSQYSEVGFRPDRAAGTIVAQGKSSLKLHGIFSLHGADHELSVHYPSNAKRRSVERDGKFRSSLI